MAEEYPLGNNPDLHILINSFQESRTRVLLSLKNGGGTLEHIEVAVHALAWADYEERRQLEFRGLTISGRRYRASVDYDRADRSGIILDPDD